MNTIKRRLLKAGLVGSGLLLGTWALRGTRRAARRAGTWQPTPWIRLHADDRVVVIVDRSEMGQGVSTGLAMLVAEELEVDPARIQTEFAPAARAYRNRIFGEQLTGGSTSLRAAWEPLRKAAALMRVRLIQAAAQEWRVDAASCRALEGEVIHPASGRRARYGALLPRAARLLTPIKVALKSPADFRVIGRPIARLDAPMKVTGAARFGCDMRLPRMRTALLARCPVFGGHMRAFDASAAQAIPGVRAVLPLASGVAVIADGFFAAYRGREALRVEWEPGALSHLNDAQIAQRLQNALGREGTVHRRDGDTDAVLPRAARRREAVYVVPYLAHATPEPMNCTAHVQPGRCDIWVPTQAQEGAQEAAATLLRLKPQDVRIHTPFLGGGFGRRMEQDFVTEAVEIARAVDAPVQVLWTRDDDIRHDRYRPAAHVRVQGGLDSNGEPIAWWYRLAGPSANADGAKNFPYTIPHVRVETVEEDPGVPTGAWRSVGHSINAFVVESFLDELAHAGGHDPYVLRRRLLRGLPRHRALLDLVTGKAGWRRSLPPGQGLGLAFHASFGTFVAQVAEVAVDGAEVRVKRVWCAVDCGQVINPDLVVAQMEGAIAFGLSAALKGGVNIAGGAVQQDHSDELLFDEMPAVEVHLVRSREAPGGVGEPGVPPIAAAVCNAIFAATGRRIRRLPIRAALAEEVLSAAQ